MILALITLLQGSAPTVGDTIWLERSVEVPAGAEIRAAPWNLDGDLGLLGQPLIRREGSIATVAYPVVAWTAGTHTLLVPGPVLIGRDGVTDSMVAEPQTIRVASVLPADRPPDQLPVQPGAGLVQERMSTPWPLLAVLALLGLVLAPVVWWWRHRGPPMVAPRPAVHGASPPLAEWAEAGESRAVAAAASRSLRGVITSHLPGVVPGLVTSRLIRLVQEQRPAWPAEEIATVLRALESAEYADRPVAEVISLADRAAVLRRRLEGAA
jgi:hypothetical protein